MFTPIHDTLHFHSNGSSFCLVIVMSPAHSLWKMPLLSLAKETNCICILRWGSFHEILGDEARPKNKTALPTIARQHKERQSSRIQCIRNYEKRREKHVQPHESMHGTGIHIIALLAHAQVPAHRYLFNIAGIR